jgi:hypothetical protein
MVQPFSAKADKKLAGVAVGTQDFGDVTHDSDVRILPRHPGFCERLPFDGSFRRWG